MLKIGLTGGIGSGKSTIARVIKTLGYPVYTSDRRAAELTNNHVAIREGLIRLFGAHIYQADRKLNKQALASIIFQNKQALQQVNSIVHPIVSADFDRWCQQQTSTLVFFESAILFESNLSHLFDRIITVSAPEETRLERVIRRDHTSKEKVIERMHNQLSDAERERMADYVIHNDDRQQVLTQILQMINHLKQQL